MLLAVAVWVIIGTTGFSCVGIDNGNNGLICESGTVYACVCVCVCVFVCVCVLCVNVCVWL